MEPFKNSHPVVPIPIHGTEYNVSVYFSTADAFYVSDVCNAEVPTYDVAVATLLYRHITEPQLSVNEIIEDSTALNCFIQAIIAHEPNIKESFDLLDQETNTYARFVQAANNTFKKMMQPVIENVSKMITPYLQDIGHATATLSAYVGNSINTLHETIIPNVTAAVTAYQKIIAPISKIGAMVASLTSGIANYLAPLLQEIHIPSISEEKKEALNNAFKQWGCYGWTLMPHADMALFKEAPLDLSTANNIMKSWCHKEDVEELFKALRETENSKQKDLEEAIFCYQERRYKACAMLLFALLDAELIRMQREEDRNPRNKKRPTGYTAAMNIRKRIEAEHNIEKKFYLLLTYTNLFACIETFFEDGKDFKKQPVLINRNFLQHGMLTKRVRKRDCIQLFLLYYNFLEFFAIINKK